MAPKRTCIRFGVIYFTCFQVVASRAINKKILLLVLAGRAVDAGCAVGGGTAPDAPVRAGAVAVLARGRVYAG